MTIIPYANIHRTAFENLLVFYFQELDADIPEQIVRGKLMELIEQQTHTAVIYVALPLVDGELIGFSIYQIDTPDSDWCKFPGWGFIREFYIAPDYRHNGFGTELAQYTEHHLTQLHAKRLYLTADDAVAFWERVGYRNTHDICSNNLEIMIKL